MSGPPQIFDRRLYAARRARARGTAFLVQDTARHLAERIAGTDRRFETALDLSSRPESFAELRHCASHWVRTALTPSPGAIAADEEALPFAPASFDLIANVLSLHTTNDLPGALIQIRRTLRPGGLFLAALFGGETLREVRAAFAAGESESQGGVSPRVSPLADVRDLGALLQRAGFASPVADVERTTVYYREFMTLVADLRALGETNPLAQRSRSFLRRRVLSSAIARYLENNAEPGGRLRVTFDIVYLTGWAGLG